MSKKIIGLVVACVLALFGGASVAVPAAAVAPAPSVTPQEVQPAKSKADKDKERAKKKAAKKAKAAREKAAKAAKAKVEQAAKAKAAAVKAAQVKAAKARADARARAKARDRYVATSGPRAAAAARAAVAARTRAAVAARAVRPAQVRAAAAAKASAAAAKAAAAAQARAAAVPKTKKYAKTKKQAVNAAKQAAKAAKQSAGATAKASAAARKSVQQAALTKAAATAQRLAASEAKAIYVALAEPRAALAAKDAAAARARAAAAATSAASARARAAAVARAAAWLRSQAAAIPPAKKSDKKAAKLRKQALRAAEKAARKSAKENERARSAAAKAATARDLATAMTVAASKAKTAAGPNASWAPTDAVTFNHPRGTKKQKYALITRLNQAIDATPSGGQIRMAMYLFDIRSVTRKLIAAHRRGVSVQVLIDDGMKNKHIKKLKKTLGKKKSARSFVAVCDHSCMSNGASTIHAKFYLFSVAGRARYVSLVSSGNPYSGNTTKSWNNTHTIVRNPEIYNSLSRYFTDMLPDDTDLNYYRTTSSGKYTVYYYPQKIRRPDDLVWMNALNKTSCKTTAPGYGNRQRRTLIRVANWGWTQPRIDVAKRLWRLHNAGCRVQVMINRGRISKVVLKALLKPSKKYGKLPVYNAWRDWRKKAIAGLYVHHKFMTIDGLLDGKNVKITWTGSQNFTALATQANNELVLRVIDDKVVDAYNGNFAFIRDKYTQRMRSVPSITREAGRVGGA